MIKLKQKHIDDFYTHFPPEQHSSEIFQDSMRHAGAIVRAAIAAGWFGDEEGIDVENPAIVLQKAREVLAAYGKAITISPS